MNKPFEFQSTISNITATHSIEYRFYVEGHRSSTNGNVTVKLSSNAGTPTIP